MWQSWGDFAGMLHLFAENGPVPVSSLFKSRFNRCISSLWAASAAPRKVNTREGTDVQFRFDDTTIAVNTATRAALAEAVTARWRAGDGFALATINLDHLAKLADDPAFVAAYAAQDLVVADGWPIVTLARIAGTPVELMPGSDLVVPLCELAAQEGALVALVGSQDAALADARAALTARVPGLAIVYARAPAMGFDPDGDAAAAILAEVAASGARLCFLALGAPKQERLAARGRRLAPAVGFASIGAGLDFLGGHQVRAPKLVRRVRLEWLWRALSSPRRMVPRYWRAAKTLPRHIAEARRQRAGA